MADTPNARMAAVLREHPALLVSAFYLAASFIGMFYSWAFLRRFGINVFNYAQISDFLLASLKEPYTWALVIIAVAFVLIDNRSSMRVERKRPGKLWAWYGSPRYRFVNNFAAILMVLAFIFAFANKQANNTLDGEGKMVDVTFAESADEQAYMLLGTTGQFVFLYDIDVRRVHIHPFEAVSEIAFQAD